MLGLIGRLADGWVPSHGHSPERLPEMQRRIDEGAERQVETHRTSAAPTTSQAESERWRQSPGRPASKWIETLTGFALEQGMDTFIFWPSEDHERQTEIFAHEVAPAVRETVQKVRT